MNQQANNLVPVPGATGYLVNENGDVFNLRPGRGYGLYLSRGIDRCGYVTHKMQWDGNAKRTTVLAHRLVGLTFIPNPDGKPTINHKDGNKRNNHVSNLEWATWSEQQHHAINTGLRIIQRGSEHWRTGLKFPSPTASTIAKMSASKKGACHPKFCGYYLTPAGRFTNLLGAAKAMGKGRQTIMRLCRDQPAEGYGFEPAPRQSAIKLQQVA